MCKMFALHGCQALSPLHNPHVPICHICIWLHCTRSTGNSGIVTIKLLEMTVVVEPCLYLSEFLLQLKPAGLKSVSFCILQWHFLACLFSNFLFGFLALSSVFFFKLLFLLLFIFNSLSFHSFFFSIFLPFLFLQILQNLHC